MRNAAPASEIRPDQNKGHALRRVSCPARGRWCKILRAQTEEGHPGIEYSVHASPTTSKGACIWTEKDIGPEGKKRIGNAIVVASKATRSSPFFLKRHSFFPEIQEILYRYISETRPGQ
jgi:hypothetical protein